MNIVVWLALAWFISVVAMMSVFIGWWVIPAYIAIGLCWWPILYVISHDDKWGIAGVNIFACLWPVTIPIVIHWWFFDR